MTIVTHNNHLYTQSINILFDQAVEQYHQAMDGIFNGDPEHMQNIFSGREDVSLSNLFGPTVLGRRAVVEAIARAAANFHDGEPAQYDTLVKVVTPELAYLVEVERGRARVGANAELRSLTFRATTIFRPEDGAWKVIHRHADPITTPRSAESIL
jgi:ketosteroid isomerase-like protein